jgi:hypothetical protein
VAGLGCRPIEGRSVPLQPLRAPRLDPISYRMTPNDIKGLYNDWVIAWAAKDSKGLLGPLDAIQALGGGGL